MNYVILDKFAIKHNLSYTELCEAMHEATNDDLVNLSNTKARHESLIDVYSEALKDSLAKLHKANSWKEAVLDQLAIHCLDTEVTATPEVILDKIIDIANSMNTYFIGEDAKSYGSRLNEATWALLAEWDKDKHGPIPRFNTLIELVRSSVLKYLKQ